MRNDRLSEISHLLSPPPGEPLWHGGATPLGALRGVGFIQAAWRPAPKRQSIWGLTLHIAYWKYAVRRTIDGSPKGSFPRKPANWPTVPAKPDQDTWNRDRKLLKTEHELLVTSIDSFPPRSLDEKVEGRRTYRYADLFHGIAAHDIYHVGQIQLLKRLYEDLSR